MRSPRRRCSPSRASSTTPRPPSSSPPTARITRCGRASSPRAPRPASSATPARLLIGVRGPEPLKQLKPDLARLTTLSAQIGAAGYFVFTLTPGAADHLTESRMFCPALGIAEDPVSGNAHGLLGAYLAQLRLLDRSGDRVRFSGIQGASLHRPGRVEVELEFKGEALGSVWISGQAVSIFETEMEF